jgi:hypothetical protein
LLRIKAEAVGLEPTIRRGGHLFSGQAPHPSRMTSKFVILQVPRVGIEPTASWFRARRHYQQQLPRSRLNHHDNAYRSKFGEKNSNLRLLVQSQAAYR